MSRETPALPASRAPAGQPAAVALLAGCLALAACAGAAPRPAASAVERTPDLFGAPNAPSSPTLPPTDAPAAGPVRVTASEAALLCLQNNRAFAVERFRPSLAQTLEDSQRTAFDPVLSAAATRAWQRVPSAGGATSGSTATTVSVGADQALPTGTSVNLALDGQVAHSSAQESARLALTVTQALLRGFGTDANLATLRQARLDTLASEYELRGFAQGLVAQAEQAYWDYALAKRRIEIVAQSLALAQDQLSETRERIRVGQLAESEQAAAEAEVARRKEAEIDARSRLATTRLSLLRLLNPPGGKLWDREVDALETPAVPTGGPDDVEDHVRLALERRPELNQARLGVQRGELEVVKTRNGLLPKLDAFVTLGKSGYADSFGGALRDLDGKGYDAQVGLRGEFPWENRAPRAADRRAVLGRAQALESVENLVQLAQVDVRAAHIEVGRLKEQVAATAATRRLQEETLRAETEKFRVGKSTNLLVAQAQRDLLQSRLGEVEAIVNTLKAVVELYRQDGSLLERLGVAAPGVRPVSLTGR